MYPTLFVVLLGIGTVFAGLILIILLCNIMSVFVKLTDKSSVTPVAAAAPQVATAQITDKQPLIAAVSAVVAEELGTDISNIKIHSIKRI